MDLEAWRVVHGRNGHENRSSNGRLASTLPGPSICHCSTSKKDTQLNNKRIKYTRKDRQVSCGLQCSASSLISLVEQSFASRRAQSTCTACKSESNPRNFKMSLSQELSAYWNQIFDDKHVRKWINFTGFALVGVDFAETSERVLTVNIHRTRATNSFTT